MLSMGGVEVVLSTFWTRGRDLPTELETWLVTRYIHYLESVVNELRRCVEWKVNGRAPQELSLMRTADDRPCSSMTELKRRAINRGLGGPSANCAKRTARHRNTVPRTGYRRAEWCYFS